MELIEGGLEYITINQQQRQHDITNPSSKPTSWLCKPSSKAPTYIDHVLGETCKDENIYLLGYKKNYNLLKVSTLHEYRTRTANSLLELKYWLRDGIGLDKKILGH